LAVTTLKNPSFLPSGASLPSARVGGWLLSAANQPLPTPHSTPRSICRMPKACLNTGGHVHTLDRVRATANQPSTNNFSITLTNTPPMCARVAMAMRTRPLFAAIAFMKVEIGEIRPVQTRHPIPTRAQLTIPRRCRPRPHILCLAGVPALVSGLFSRERAHSSGFFQGWAGRRSWNPRYTICVFWASL
jgi:hypothetical protein